MKTTIKKDYISGTEPKNAENDQKVEDKYEEVYFHE